MNWVFGLAFFLKGCPQVQMRANLGKFYTWVQSRCSHGLHCTIIDEFTHLWRFAYVKLFFPVPHRWSFTIAKNPHTPQKLLDTAAPSSTRWVQGWVLPEGPLHHQDTAPVDGETVLSSGRHLLLLIPSLTLFWASLKANIKRFPD